MNAIPGNEIGRERIAAVHRLIGPHIRRTPVIHIDAADLGLEPPELAPTLTRGLAAGKPVDAEAAGIAADSLAPRRVGEPMFPIADRQVERVLLVSDSARVLRVVAEPGGAAALAALSSGSYRPGEGEQVGVVICGGNTNGRGFRPLS